MMNMQERQTMANQLAKLRAQIIQYDDWVLKAIPPDLQQQARSFSALQPITSSGLEPVHTIINRLDWAIHFLNDPHFPENQQKQRTSMASTSIRQVVDTSRNSPPQYNNQEPKVTAMKLVSQPATTSSKPLDFGPFGPKSHGS